MRFLIASSRKTAKSTAEIDWNWLRYNNDWIDHDGERVPYADRPEHMQGYGRGTVIYLGYRWFDSWDEGRLRALAAAGGYELLQPAAWEPSSLPRTEICVMKATYNVAMDKASQEAGSGPGWNVRYVQALKRHGLKLIPQPDGVLPLKLRPFCTCPIPTEGDAEPYHYPSLIVPKDFTP